MTFFRLRGPDIPTKYSEFINIPRIGERCGTIELRAAECFAAYGWHKGMEKCKDYLDDFQECLTHAKQLKRIQLMNEERKKQIREGKRKPYDREVPLDLY